MALLTATLFGFLGGLIRASIGLLKIRTKIKKEFKLSKLLFTLITSAIIGAVVALALTTNNVFYLAAGYAGTDLIEGAWKAR